jgi:hypothetical protein
VKLFDVGQEAYGVIAIGQFATGVFAFGQIATGIVAIGQVARGVFVIGQVAVGVVSVGQLAFGLYAAWGMLGLAGRRGGGIVLKIFPRRDEDEEDLPPLVPAADVLSGQLASGWSRVRVALRSRDDGAPKDVVLLDERSTLDLDFEPEAIERLREIGASDWPVALVQLKAEERLAAGGDAAYREAPPKERVVVAARARASPRPPFTEPKFWILGVARAAGFAGMCAVYWYAVARDLLAMLIK